MITRENYREYDAVNYSTLSSLSKHPSKVIEERDWSDGIQSGDVLDILCFDGEEALFEKYYVSEFSDRDLPSNTVKQIIDESGDYSDESLLDVAKRINYGQSWSEETILRKIFEGGQKYINLLEESGNRKVIGLDFYTSMFNAADQVKNDPNTRMFFEGAEFQKPMTTNIKIEDSDVAFKCLCDIYINDREAVIVGDLKFTSKPLSSFEYEFMKWRYDIQSSLYSTIPRLITNKPVEFYNIVYSSTDRAVYRFKVHQSTIYCGEHGGTINGRDYKGWKELTKEYLWHKKHNIWNLPYEFCVNSELIINPYGS